MATKQVAFTTLTVTQHFTRINHGGEKCMKLSATLARSLDIDGSASFRVRGSEMVAIEVADPTPAEVAAFRLRILNHRLADMLERGASAQQDLAKTMAQDHGWFAVFTSSGSIENQMKAAARLHVATRALGILNHAEGGIDVLTSEACRQAMRYARYGHHSTSAVSNVAEEMQAAAWAEVAEACGWDRQ